jgi:hypothetical protein
MACFAHCVLTFVGSWNGLWAKYLLKGISRYTLKY